MTTVKLSDVILPDFHEFWRLSRAHQFLRYVLKGGRNSGKSSVVAMKTVHQMMRHRISALIVRRVANTLQDSVFEQLKEAIDLLGVGQYWKVNLSPLRLTYKPYGNSIIFRGADDPQKIKGIKASKFPIAILWIEEIAEFRTEDDVLTIEQSVLRAELPDGLDYSIYWTYNPPTRRQHWLNQKHETHVAPANTYIHHSTYVMNRHLSKVAWAEAEEMKIKNPQKYEWQYLGKPVGSGVVPFGNLSFRTITEDEMKSFDNIRQGNDWGYGVDPLAFVRWHYDKTRRRIFAIDEIYGVQLSNRLLANELKRKGYDDTLITSDSAEPKSIDEMRHEYGIRMKGAKKGPGSVEYGEKWLADLDEIVIDPKRTPNLAREFESIDYMTDADGNPKAKLEDKNNHTIDATRYAFEADMKRAGVSF